MTEPNRIHAVIESFTEQEAKLRTDNKLISVPLSFIPPSKKIGDDLILKITDTDHDEEEHYFAMKRLLKEIVQ